jgi:hypothetical protein
MEHLEMAVALEKKQMQMKIDSTRSRTRLESSAEIQVI